MGTMVETVKTITDVFEMARVFEFRMLRIYGPSELEETNRQMDGITRSRYRMYAHTEVVEMSSPL